MNWKALQLLISEYIIILSLEQLIFKHTTIICFVIICLITKSDDWKIFKLHQTIKFKQFETIFLYQKIIMFKRFQMNWKASHINTLLLLGQLHNFTLLILQKAAQDRGGRSPFTWKIAPQILQFRERSNLHLEANTGRIGSPTTK